MTDDIVRCKYGWATRSESPPPNRDLFWITGNGTIYTWDGEGNGWVQIDPPILYPCKEINHG